MQMCRENILTVIHKIRHLELIAQWGLCTRALEGTILFRRHEAFTQTNCLDKPNCYRPSLFTAHLRGVPCHADRTPRWARDCYIINDSGVYGTTETDTTDFTGRQTEQ